MGLLESLQEMETGSYPAGSLSQFRFSGQGLEPRGVVCYLFNHCLLSIASPTIGPLPVTKPLSSLITGQLFCLEGRIKGHTLTPPPALERILVGELDKFINKLCCGP